MRPRALPHDSYHSATIFCEAATASPPSTAVHGTNLYCFVTEACTRVCEQLTAEQQRKSTALTTTPPRHTFELKG